MFESIFSQYMLIGLAVIILLSIKYFTINKSYSNQLSTFVHPDLLVDEVKKKLKKIPDNDPRIILAQNLTALSK